MINVTQMGQKIQSLLGKKAEEVAKESKFVQRQSKMTGVVFLLTVVLGFLEEPKASLNFLCQVAEDLGVSISKQGLQERLTDNAVEFMKQMFGLVKENMENKVPIPLKLLTQFKVVQLMDSTVITLPKTQAEEFAGAGGSGSSAAMKLQTIWDFLRGNLTEIWITPARKSDQGFKKHLDYIEPGGLFVADLGYFVLGLLQQIADKEAYFLTRFKAQTGLRNPVTGEKFDLFTYLKQTTAAEVELYLWVGFDVKLPARLLAVRLPDAVVAERRRKAKSRAKRKGRTLSQRHLAWLAWSIYITNVPASMLSLAQVALIYSLRWQIELLFKLWKSEGRLDRVAGIGRQRILCELYAKLIGFVLFHYLTSPLRWDNRELSPTKALQTFRRHIVEFGRSLNSLPDLISVLHKLIRRWRRFARKDKRRKRLSTSRQIELAVAQLLLPSGIDQQQTIQSFAESKGTIVSDSASQSEVLKISPTIFWQLVYSVLFTATSLP